MYRRAPLQRQHSWRAPHRRDCRRAALWQRRRHMRRYPPHAAGRPLALASMPRLTRMPDTHRCGAQLSCGSDMGAGHMHTSRSAPRMPATGCRTQLVIGPSDSSVGTSDPMTALMALIRNSSVTRCPFSGCQHIVLTICGCGCPCAVAVVVVAQPHMLTWPTRVWWRHSRCADWWVLMRPARQPTCRRGCHCCHIEASSAPATVWPTMPPALPHRGRRQRRPPCRAPSAQLSASRRVRTAHRSPHYGHEICP